MKVSFCSLSLQEIIHKFKIFLSALGLAFAALSSSSADGFASPSDSLIYDLLYQDCRPPLWCQETSGDMQADSLNRLCRPFGESLSDNISDPQTPWRCPSPNLGLQISELSTPSRGI